MTSLKFLTLVERYLAVGRRQSCANAFLSQQDASTDMERDLIDRDLDLDLDLRISTAQVKSTLPHHRQGTDKACSVSSVTELLGYTVKVLECDQPTLEEKNTCELER